MTSLHSLSRYTLHEPTTSDQPFLQVRGYEHAQCIACFPVLSAVRVFVGRSGIGGRLDRDDPSRLPYLSDSMLIAPAMRH